MYKSEKNIDDIIFILDNLREEDKLEAIENNGLDYKKLLLEQFENTQNEIIIGKTKKENKPVLMYGAWATENPLIACIWLLSTPDIVNNKICFIKELKKQIKEYDSKYYILFNKIYKKNYLAKNWLKAVGFRFPSEEENKTQLDYEFLKIKTSKDFEYFYRERK